MNVDTSRVLTAHYTNFEVSPPDTTLIAAGDSFDVPITLYYPYSYSLMTIQFNLNFPDASLDFIDVREGSDMGWNTLTAVPMGGGAVVIYGNRSPSYVDPPVVLCIARFVSTGSTAEIDTITLSGLSYDIADAGSNPGILIVGAPIDVVVRTDYVGEDAKLWIDGAQSSSPFEATWLAGEPHSIGALRYFGDGATRAAWQDWSDGGEIQHDIAPMISDTFVAHYGTEHYLSIVAPYGSPFGEGFYAEGDSAEFGLTDETVVDGETEYTFAAWAGDGSGHYSGADNPARCRIDAPITETAIYNERYHLTVDGVYSSATGEGWFAAGWPAEFAVADTIVAVSEGTRRVFEGWSGAYTGPDNPATWIVAGPNVETAEWRLEQLLTIESVRG
ncbi:hypothetical protein J7L01_02435, partial [bacterium]|nr:hypothetical protein [bacterium]